MQEFLKKFVNPTNQYRALPFWSWNDKLDPKLLQWQIREMQRQGLGGYFMHARAGLETEYLSEEWLNCIQECIIEGNRLGLESWLYDESGWPSGFAGGLVTAHGDEYYGRWLTLKDFQNQLEDSNINGLLGLYLVEENGFILLETLAQAKMHYQVGRRVLVIQHHPNRDYIDVLNAKTVKLFIDYTHNQYLKRFGKEFGKGLKGFFTDEPRLSGSIEKDIPWSYIIPEHFEARYGYDIIQVLPALFLPYADYPKIRYDFWQLVNDLFVHSFMKQINDWCITHHLVLTGHAMMEESLFTQMTSTGGVMPFYQHMGMPGIDWLRRTISTPIVPKQVASVAAQLGKSFVLTESYALSGWDVSFEELKWITEWQYVHGVNRMCQHLQGYTIRGLRKRDYPPSLFIQQSWWEQYKIYNDYLARLGVILSEGKQVVDIIVIHPIQSGWIAYDGQKNSKLENLDQDFIAISQILSGAHFDYHFGDETIMKEHGSVDGNKLIVGDCAYKVAILPSMLTLSKNTLSLLQQFVTNGGLVISAGEYPKFINGKSNEALTNLHEKIIPCGLDCHKIFHTLKEYGAAHVSVTENNIEISDIHYHQRNMGSFQLYFLVNHSTETSHYANVELPGIGHIQQMVAETGKLQAVSYTHQGNSTFVNLEFLPRQSYILLFTYDSTSCKKSLAESSMETMLVELNDVFSITKMDLNSLTLDRCDYRINGGKWEGSLPIIHLMDKLLGLRQSCNLEMKFDFKISSNLRENSDFYLVLEDAEQFKIWVNGTGIIYQDIGWWKDTSFKKVDIKEFIVQGNNEIILERKFYQSPKVYHVLFGEDVYETEKNQLTYDVELESIYLVGDFGVVTASEHSYGIRKASFTAGPFEIVDLPKTVTTGDLSYQGLLFFAGKISLSQTLSIDPSANTRVILSMQKPDAPLAQLSINDKIVKTLLWSPYDIDITDYVISGENTITIKLFASNRNLLGPHHHIDGELYNVGPESFTGKWSWVEKKSETETTNAKIRQQSYWQDDYCFVRFGIPTNTKLNNSP